LPFRSNHRDGFGFPGPLRPGGGVGSLGAKVSPVPSRMTGGYLFSTKHPATSIPRLQRISKSGGAYRAYYWPEGLSP
jgi:hypothetical protein